MPDIENRSLNALVFLGLCKQTLQDFSLLHAQLILLAATKKYLEGCILDVHSMMTLSLKCKQRSKKVRSPILYAGRQESTVNLHLLVRF